MKITRIGSVEHVIQVKNSDRNYFAWPTAVRLQNGKIAVVVSGFRRRHICPFGKTVIVYSSDEGKTYTSPEPVIETVLDDRDGGVMTFGESGVIVTSFNNTTKFQRERPFADDYDKAYLDSITEEQEAEALGASFRISNDCGATFGERFKSPITSPHGPIQLKDGTIFWVGHLFAMHNEHERNNIKAYTINVNDGSMEFVGEIEDVYVDGEHMLSCEPYAIELNDGSILVHIRANKNGSDPVFTLFQTISHDKGKTWSKPEQILSRAGGAPSHLFRTSKGEIICTFGYRKGPYSIKGMVSKDEGKTWSEVFDIFTEGASWDIGYPSTVELDDGTFLTVFYAKDDGSGPAIIMQQRWIIENE